MNRIKGKMRIDSPEYGIIRRFEPRDVERVLEIASNSLSEYYTNALILDLHRTWPDGFKVYTSNETIVGFIICSRNTPNEARILMFAVDPAYRSRGIGAALMKDFLAFCSRNSFLSIKLEVKTDNEGAINFYKTFGFVITSRLRAYYSDASDAFTMWKII